MSEILVEHPFIEPNGTQKTAAVDSDWHTMVDGSLTSINQASSIVLATVMTREGRLIADHDLRPLVDGFISTMRLERPGIELALPYGLREDAPITAMNSRLQSGANNLSVSVSSPLRRNVLRLALGSGESNFTIFLQNMAHYAEPEEKVTRELRRRRDISKDQKDTLLEFVLNKTGKSS